MSATSFGTAEFSRAKRAAISGGSGVSDLAYASLKPGCRARVVKLALQNLSTGNHSWFLSLEECDGSFPWCVAGQRPARLGSIIQYLTKVSGADIGGGLEALTSTARVRDLPL